MIEVYMNKKTVGFLIFSEGSNGKIRKKSVNS